MGAGRVQVIRSRVVQYAIGQIKLGMMIGKQLLHLLDIRTEVIALDRHHIKSQLLKTAR